MTMADLLAKQDLKAINITRGQELTGTVIAISGPEIIFDIGSKAEGIIPKKDLNSQQIEQLQPGKSLPVFVLQTENEAGQVVLTLHRAGKPVANLQKWQKFLNALQSDQTFQGKGLEVNKGGLIVEVGGMRGFLPSSQVALNQLAALEELVGKEIPLKIIEADPGQNRLIFSQKIILSPEVKEKLSLVKENEKVQGVITAILPFGVAVKLSNGLDGFVHSSEVAWERSEDLTKIFEVEQTLETKVISVDMEAGRVNLSVKSLIADPFSNISEKFQADDVVKAKVSKITATGVLFTLEGGVEGLMPTANIEAGTEYQPGDEVTVIIDKVDSAKRKITLAPLLTSTDGLIYK